VLTVLFMVAMINIVNWSKGVDGQMPGVAGVAMLFIGALSLRFADPAQLGVSALSFITAGAFLGFLIWNFYPQKIMPGYGGGSLAGFLLAALAILSGAKVATLLMVLALPAADAAFTMLRRIRAGKSPYYGDRGHLHHKLLDEYGWGRRRIAVFYWLITAVLGALALFLPTWGKIVVIGGATAVTFGFLIGTKLRERTR
jgi:UDP-GlcNAc:undecaprenyl-phosphate GlcNAc-1-phosphate transferase